MSAPPVHAPRRPLSVLDAVQIARPCPADWAAMRAVPGQHAERVRHCDECGLRVYHLSAMTRADAEALVAAGEGRLCVRLYRRGDGTVLTQDCSYFRRIAQTTTAGARRLAWLATCGLATLLGAAIWTSVVLGRESRPFDAGNNGPTFAQRGLDYFAQLRPLDRLINWARPAPNMPPGMMGDMAVAGRMSFVSTADDLAQGFVNPTPLPAVPPQQWLQTPDQQRVPL